MEREAAVALRGICRRLEEGFAALLLYAEAIGPAGTLCRVLDLGGRLSSTPPELLPALAAGLENDFAAARLYLCLIGAEEELEAVLL